MEYDINDVRINDTQLQLGDIVHVHGEPYIVKEIKYEGSVNTLPTIRYELDKLCPVFDDYQYDSRFIFPVKAEITQIPQDIRPPEEISEETRKDFIKLLE